MLSPRLIIAAVLAVVLAFTHFFTYRAGRAAVRSEWDKDRAKQLAVIDAQRARNLDLQRAAEIRYTVHAAAREKLIVETITEVRYVTANLAACAVSPDAVRLLNRAAGCARSGAPTTDCASEPVRSP